MKLVASLKRLFYITGAIGVLTALLFGQLTAVNAVNEFCTGEAANSVYCQAQDNPTDPTTGDDNIISTVITFFSWLVAIASVIMLVIGGLRMVFSQGDAKTVASARTSIIYAVVGIAVVVLAQALVVFVVKKL